jgi:hypothetical protein
VLLPLYSSPVGDQKAPHVGRLPQKLNQDFPAFDDRATILSILASLPSQVPSHFGPEAITATPGLLIVIMLLIFLETVLEEANDRYLDIFRQGSPRTRSS